MEYIFLTHIHEISYKSILFYLFLCISLHLFTLFLPQKHFILNIESLLISCVEIRVTSLKDEIKNIKFLSQFDIFRRIRHFL